MSEEFESSFLKPITRRFELPELEINYFRPESHVAQQRRRDKLRIPLNSAQAHRPQNLLNHLGRRLPSDSAVNADLPQVRSVTNCDTTMFSSEMLNFSMNTHVLLSSKDAVLHPEADADHSGRSVGSDYTALPISSQAVSSNFFVPSAKVSVPQDPCFWKGIGSQHSSDWIVNYVNASGGNTCGQSPLFEGEVLPGNVREANLSVSSLYPKHGGNMYQDVQSSLTNHSSEISPTQECQKHYGEMNFASSFYQNALQEVVTSSTVGSQGFEIASLVQQNNIRPTNHSTWMNGGNESVLHPAYGVEANASRLNDPNIASMHNKPLDGSHNWNSELAFSTSRCGRGLEAVAGECSSRGLSLSLSSHQPSEIDMSRFGERIGSQSLQSAGICNGSEDSKSSYSGYICSNTKVPTINKSYGYSMQGIVGSSTYPRRSMGPLGPFTGYATILKNSKYLKHAQQLLDELCGSTGSRLVKTCEMSGRDSREVSISSDLMNVETEINGGIGGSSGVSSSSFNSSSETGGEGQVGPGSCQSYQPEFQQRKAKLLCMREEVCRRYKQYHQQMQMVVSSFESVAGLSSATPYTSLALKTVAKHFRCLKSAISDQLRRISMVLGEDLLSHAGGTHSFEGDMTMPKLKFLDQSLRKQKSDGNRLGFLEPQQHVWRPQRGLPERAVAVLRAWLFDHFLHPYPTDTDKHMLASQTGLSRNQVSNWFINARVRVWKPMVEEMHMLETKGSAEMGLESSNSNAKSNACGSGRRWNQAKKSPECPAVDPMQRAEARRSSEQWPQENRSRMDCHIPSDASLGLMGMVPYHQSGLGAVSLTLGLRHNTDGADHQQQQQQQQEHHLRRHYGAPLFQEFVG